MLQQCYFIAQGETPFLEPLQLQIIADAAGKFRSIDMHIQFMMGHPQFNKPALGGMKIGFQR